MNEVTIISEERDISTDKIIDYINYFGGKVSRFDYETGLSNISINISNDTFSTSVEDNDKKVHLNNTNNFYRRGLFNLKINLPNSLREIVGFEKFYSKENSLTNAFLFNSSDFTGNYVKEIDNNKLINLLLAKEIGLSIPSTIITTSKTEALEFVKRNVEVITKPIHNGHINFETPTETIGSTGTRLVSEGDVQKLNTSFAPMLMQKCINKELEIRAFFFNNKFYSMAIFSQKDEKTSLDYRNYNQETPNRGVPFKMPTNIEIKLKKLMRKLKMNTGSIDIILTPDQDFVFLEINPTGQYDWVSLNCNYNIDEIIAKTLLHNNLKKNEILS